MLYLYQADNLHQVTVTQTLDNYLYDRIQFRCMRDIYDSTKGHIVIPPCQQKNVMVPRFKQLVYPHGLLDFWQTSSFQSLGPQAFRWYMSHKIPRGVGGLVPGPRAIPLHVPVFFCPLTTAYKHTYNLSLIHI